MRNPHQPEIVVIDPRATETAMQATLHLAPQPKSDLTLLYAVARLLIERDWIDREFIAAHTQRLRCSSPSSSKPIRLDTRGRRNRPGARVDRAVGSHLFTRASRVSFWWTMGVNQSHQGVRTAQAIINLALDDRQHRPARHGRQLRSPASATRWARGCSATRPICWAAAILPTPPIAARWPTLLASTSVASRAKRVGPITRFSRACCSGKIRGLWVVGTNPAHSWINQNYGPRHPRRGSISWWCRTCITTTETAQIGRSVLPAAGWGEKEGTFINSERRIGRINKVARAPGQALADFHIFRAARRVLGLRRDVPRAGRRRRQCLNCSNSSRPASRATSRASTATKCSTRRGGVQWPFPARRRRLNGVRTTAV